MLQLLKARLAGIELFIVAFDGTYGRESINTKPPRADAPHTHDNGRIIRKYRFEGRLSGDTAALDFRRLRDACESKGPLDFVHPIDGAMKVTVVADFRVSRDEGDNIPFNLQLDEVTQALAYPLPALPDVVDKAGSVATSAAAGFASAMADMAAIVETATSAVKAAQTYFDTTVRAALLGPIVAVDGATDALLDALDAFADLTIDILGAPEKISDAIHAIVTKVTQSSTLLRLSTLFANTPNDNASKATYQYVRIESLAQAATQAVAEADAGTYSAASDLLAVRDTLHTALAYERNILPVYDVTFADLATSAFEALTEAAAKLGTLTVYTTDGPSSSLDIAFALYGDSTRADEIEDRNGIAAVMFIPAAPLSVLIA